MKTGRETVLKGLRGVFAVAFLLIIIVFGGRLAYSAITHRDEPLADRFPAKGRIVAFNGLCWRLAGRHQCNNRVRMDNGKLNYAYFKVDEDLSWKLQKEVALARNLKKRGIHFIHVQAPMAMDAEKRLLPPGHYCDGNEKATEFVTSLTSNGVETVNLVPRFTSTPDDVTRFFLRTDHHWNYDAAFLAAKIVTDRLLTQLDERLPGPSHPLDPSKWWRKELPQWRLGTHGRRTGAFFSGFDDLQYYLPKKDTKTFARTLYLKNGQTKVRKGGFQAAMLNRGAVSVPDHASEASFVLHSRVDHLAKFRNPAAPVKRRVLILGDSFARPIPAYLSTVFQEIDMIDPRHFKSCWRYRHMSIAGYVQHTHPDIVVMMCNPSSFYADTGDGGLQKKVYQKMFRFGKFK